MPQEKETTAVSQLIDELKETLKECQPEFSIGIKHSILKASAYLEIERQQIEDAYKEGGKSKIDESPQQYFESTFTQQQ